MAREKMIPFNFEMPLSVFEKADAPEGQRRRIGGIASIETKDKEEETVLARGLDFSDFLKNGWFNDNHSKATDGILGYPEDTHLFQKGSELPDGEIAEAPGHWVEGFLLEGHPPADRIWGLAKALQKTRRKLGFSVEGKVLKRTGIHKGGHKVVAKAKVRNVAITGCPVNTGASMGILAKSLQTVESADDTHEDSLLQQIYDKVEVLEKALTAGAAVSNRPPTGPQTGADAGQVLTGQSLEQDDDPPRVVEEGSTAEDNGNGKGKTKKSMSYETAIRWVMGKLPNSTRNQARRIVELTKKRKAQNKL